MLRCLFLSTFVFGSALASATSYQLPATSKNFEVKVGNFAKKYPIALAPGATNVEIAYLYDLNDNFPLAIQVAEHLAKEIKAAGLLKEIEAVVVPGDKANMMAGMLMQKLSEMKPSLKFAILRSTSKGGSYKSVDYQSITSSTPKTLHLRQDQFESLRNLKVMVFDDVISTGGTVRAVRDLMGQANAKVVGYSCFATEGDEIQKLDNKPLFKVTHLPVTVLQ